MSSLKVNPPHQATFICTLEGSSMAALRLLVSVPCKPDGCLWRVPRLKKMVLAQMVKHLRVFLLAGSFQYVPSTILIHMVRRAGQSGRGRGK